MTEEMRVHPLSQATRELRRLGLSSPVTTTYLDHRTPAHNVAPCEVEAVSEHQRGYDEGFALGLAESRVEVERHRRDVEERAAAASSALAHAATLLEKIHQEVRSEFQTRLPELALDVVTEILGHELQLRANPGRDALARALRLDDDDGAFTVRMNPQDLATLGDIGDPSGARRFTFIADEAIQSGGVVVQSDSVTLDARIDTALQRVHRVLESALNAGESDDRAA